MLFNPAHKMADDQYPIQVSSVTSSEEQASTVLGQLVIGSSTSDPHVITGSPPVGSLERASASQEASALGVGGEEPTLTGVTTAGDRKGDEGRGRRDEKGRPGSEEGREGNEGRGEKSEEGGKVNAGRGNVTEEGQIEGAVRVEEGAAGQSEREMKRGEGEKKGAEGEKGGGEGEKKEERVTQKGGKHGTVKTDKKGGSGTSPVPSKDEPMECPICRSSLVHAVQTPCGHIFCFLCIKGVLARDSRCCLCREQVPPDFLEHPSLLATPHLEATEGGPGEGQYLWYYSARSTGWWMFEERTSCDIEDAYQRKLENTRVFISGFQYIIDFKEMVQYREQHPNRTRRIKREKAANAKDVKGVAGIKAAPSTS